MTAVASSSFVSSRPLVSPEFRSIRLADDIHEVKGPIKGPQELGLKSILDYVYI